MQRQTEQRLAAEALERIDRRTVPQADGTMAIDGARYTSTAALAAENSALFRRHPLLAAFGCEIARPGDYLALDIAGVPVLLVRDDDGAVHGLLNTCRHCGTRLLEGAGSIRKAFACPYHGWIYDRCGVLRGLPGGEHFTGVTVGDARLVRFPAAERDGFVWLRARLRRHARSRRAARCIRESLKNSCRDSGIHGQLLISRSSKRFKQGAMEFFRPSLESVVTKYQPRAPDTESAPRQETMRHSWRIAWQSHANA